MLGDVLPDAFEDRARKLVLISLVVKTLFFLWIRDEGGLDQDRRHVGRLEDREACLLHACFMKRVDRAEALEHRAAEPQAMVDGRGLRQVEKRLLEVSVLALEADAA